MEEQIKVFDVHRMNSNPQEDLLFADPEHLAEHLNSYNPAGDGPRFLVTIKSMSKSDWDELEEA